MADFERIIAEIRRRLALAGERQRRYGTHERYEATPATEPELSRLEVRLGVTLPDEYRAVLAHVGYRAGPYYGLLSPQAIVTQLDADRESVDQDDVASVLPSGDFPHDRASLAPGSLRRGRPLVHGRWPEAGCIPIAHQGCGNYTVLALTGRSAGTVWDVHTERALWYAAGPVPGGNEAALSHPPAFLEWYLAWLRFIAPQARSDSAEK